MSRRSALPEVTQITQAVQHMRSPGFREDRHGDEFSRQWCRVNCLPSFNPNVDPGFDPKTVGGFLNDSIIRCLAGVTKSGRPIFLKIPYNGPGPLEELVSYDSNLVVGILGGSAGTTRDAFQLIHDASQYGARVALFGRKINLSEHPLSFIELLRRVTDREIGPEDAVRCYHDGMAKAKIQPIRPLEEDLQITETSMSYS